MALAAEAADPGAVNAWIYIGYGLAAVVGLVIALKVLEWLVGLFVKFVLTPFVRSVLPLPISHPLRAGLRAATSDHYCLRDILRSDDDYNGPYKLSFRVRYRWNLDVLRHTGKLAPTWKQILRTISGRPFGHGLDAWTVAVATIRAVQDRYSSPLWDSRVSARLHPVPTPGQQSPRPIRAATAVAERPTDATGLPSGYDWTLFTQVRTKPGGIIVASSATGETIEIIQTRDDVLIDPIPGSERIEAAEAAGHKVQVIRQPGSPTQFLVGISEQPDPEGPSS